MSCYKNEKRVKCHFDTLYVSMAITQQGAETAYIKRCLCSDKLYVPQMVGLQPKLGSLS